MHLHPAGDPLVIALFKPHLMLGRRVGDALAGLCIPDGRVGHADDLLPPEPAVFRLDAVDLLKYLSGDQVMKRRPPRPRMEVIEDG